MSHKPASKRTRPKPKAVLRLPDLDQAKSAVLKDRTPGLSASLLCPIYRRTSV